MIDVIVVNYRTNNDLYNFIETFRLTAPKEAVLTVVDVDPAFPYDYRDVPGTLIRTNTNIGYGRACNLGAKESQGDIIAFFNADIMLLEGTLQKCADALRVHDDWGVLGPYQYDTQGLVTHGGILGTNDKPVQRGWHKRKSSDYQDVHDNAVMVMGSAFFVKRKCWDELLSCPVAQEQFPNNDGCFPNNIFLFYEETVISYHAASHGWKNVYYGEAECIHQWHGSIKIHGHNGAFQESQKIFRRFCDAHGISHD